MATTLLSPVVLPEALHGQRLKVDAAPMTMIGQDQVDAADLQVITNATRLPDGHIVVGNRGDHALFLFDAKGAFVRRTARKGRGPGEVNGLSFLYRCGDRIYTHDTMGGRVQEFTLDLTYRRAFRFAVDPFRTACNDRQQFVQMGWESDKAMVDGPFRPTVDYLLAGADSLKGTLLGRFPGSERFANEPLPLGKQPRVAISSDRVFIALSDSLHVQVFDRTGKPLAPYRAAWTPVSSSDADWKAEMERDIAQFGEALRKPIEASYQKKARPKTLPATRDIIADALGNLWVQAFPRGGSAPVTWTVFDSKGAVTARISLPSSLDVVEIGRDYLLGLAHHPDNDFPEVRVYRVTR
ncbi:MAG TPA: 6-bladed beta-propeller [Gemmatimonas sp.]|uniref:6-bladed beta-propeller n=1 Tax=Gemmatimonas sp. TaxID=1962908 RepID=UPI002ED87B94